jgi:hypothetical protein
MRRVSIASGGTDLVRMTNAVGGHVLVDVFELLSATLIRRADPAYIPIRGFMRTYPPASILFQIWSFAPAESL